MYFLFFFFKQKTAYEMRISDWSSDVCSSDLDTAGHLPRRQHERQSGEPHRIARRQRPLAYRPVKQHLAAMPRPRFIPLLLVLAATGAAPQSRHDPRAPIDFSAGHGEPEAKGNQSILAGGVVIRQAEMTLEAGRVPQSYTRRTVDGSPHVSSTDAA